MDRTRTEALTAAYTALRLYEQAAGAGAAARSERLWALGRLLYAARALRRSA